MEDCKHEDAERCRNGYWKGALICNNCGTVLEDAPPAHRQPKPNLGHAIKVRPD